MEAVLKKEILINKTSCRVFGVATFIILTSLGAFVRIPLPFTPVPLTLQTFFVLLSGVFLGSRLGAVTQLSYIFLGVLGLPVFTGAGSGLSYLFGPTGGYLFGFILAAFFLGKFMKYSRDNLFAAFSILFIGALIILSSGIIWLSFIFRQSLMKSLFMGFIPFIPGDLLKALVAAFIYVKLRSRLKEIF
ncbi:MAG: biotin transporter BioY [Candidatus Omnitrophota bacterium]